MHATLKRNGLFSSLTLAAILAVGIVTTVALLFTGGAYFFAFPSSGSYQNLDFTVEGKPLLVTSYFDSLRQAEYRTLDGTLIADRKSIDLQDNSSSELPTANFELGVDSSWIWRIFGFLQPTPNPTFWYLLHDGEQNGKAYFVGYDRLTKQQIGYLGRGGFRTTLPPSDDRFELSRRLFVLGGLGPGAHGRGNQPGGFDKEWPQLYLMDDGGLRKIDLERQSVESLPIPDKIVSLGHYDHLTAISDNRRTTSEPRLVVRLPNQLQILNTAGEPTQRVELTELMRDKVITVRGTTIGELILETKTPHDSYAPHDIYWVGSDGKLLRHEVVDIWKRPLPDGSAPYWVISAVMPVPLLLMALTLVDANSHRHARMRIDFTQRLTEIISNGWLPFVLVAVVCLALAVYAYRRQRRFGVRSAWAWSLFVFLCGPVGLAGYLLHRSWPAVANCEHCGKVTPRDRPTCLVCTEEFPPPALKGVEVFA